MADTAIQSTPNPPADTAIQSTPNAAPAAPALASREAKRSRVHQTGVAYWLWKSLTVLASLRITVVLFSLALLLIFFATLAQVDEGIWAVVSKYFRSWSLAWIPFQVFVRFGQVFLSLPANAHLAGRFPFPSGWQLGALLLVNLLAAHTVRFKLSWKRSGIVVLHAGVGILMLGELIAGYFQTEGQMQIDKGELANYVVDVRSPELAVVDVSDPKFDDTVVVPSTLLRQHIGGRVENDVLPFDVEVLRYMVNSEFKRPDESGEPNPATAGMGQRMVAVARPEVSGTDQGETQDIGSAYVTLSRKGTGQPLGTYLLSCRLVNPETVVVDDKKYEVSLRFKRTYKPYTVQLEEFHQDFYIGTSVPKNFSSKVRLRNPEHNEDREALIYMNSPLRYNGETLYQSGVLEGGEGTILQVVYNPGWLMPYLGCIVVAAGMLLHFGQHLIQFLTRRAAL